MKTFEQSECKSIVESFKVLFAEKKDRPNMFIIPYDPSQPRLSFLFDKILSSLRTDFKVELFEPPRKEGSLFDFQRRPNTSSFKCIVIDSPKTEKVRDVIKEALWAAGDCRKPKYSLQEVFSRKKSLDTIFFRLSDYGVFVPYKAKNYGDLRTHCFSHKPFFYRYRIVTSKTRNVPENLSSYLELLFTDCPNHLFQKSNFRSSARASDEYDFEFQLIHSQSHELIDLAVESLSFGEYKSRHENLQKFLLLNDPLTVASEVPLWLEPDELEDYSEIFHSNDVLTGHVDILRYEKDGRLGVWDYKPRARDDSDAKIQVFLYALMLSIRTGTCLKNVTCGYFDESDIFHFDPCDVATFNG
jgi:hypothetical protein